MGCSVSRVHKTWISEFPNSMVFHWEANKYKFSGKIIEGANLSLVQAVLDVVIC